MKTHCFKLVLLVSICLLSTSCSDDCDNSIEIRTTQFLQLKSTNGQNLWFGTSAIFNPDSALFISETSDTLPFEVDQILRSIQLTFPETKSISKQIVLQLNPEESDKLTYSTSEITEECGTQLVVDFVRYNGREACVRCGDGRFNVTREIILKKLL